MRCFSSLTVVMVRPCLAGGLFEKLATHHKRLAPN
jgi:hypothetical protein